MGGPSLGVGLPYVGRVSPVLGGSCPWWTGLRLEWGFLPDLSSVDQELKNVSGSCPPGLRLRLGTERHPHLAVPLSSPLTGSTLKTLQEVQLPLIPRYECQLLYGLTSFLLPEMFCAGDIENEKNVKNVCEVCSLFFVFCFGSELGSEVGRGLLGWLDPGV